MKQLPDGTYYCERCDLRFDSPSLCMAPRDEEEVAQ